jgi:hypothetical protein
LNNKPSGDIINISSDGKEIYMKKITEKDLLKAQEKGKKILQRLEHEGYIISEYTKEMINKDVSKMTQKQSKLYISRMTRKYIKSRASKSAGKKYFVNINPVYLQKNPIVDIKYSQRAAQLLGNKTFSVRSDKYGFANDIFNMLQTASTTYSHSVDVQNKVRNIYRALKLEIPTADNLAEDVLNLEKELKEKLRSIDKDAFINSVHFQMFLKEGVYSVETVAARRELSLMSSKQTFKSNYSLDYDKVESIYDFFQKSSQWQQVRKQFKPSDDMVFDSFLDNVSDALDNNEVTVKDIDRQLMNFSGHKSLTKVIDDAIIEAKKRG